MRKLITIQRVKKILETKTQSLVKQEPSSVGDWKERTTIFIQSYEGLRLKAYWDVTHYSIGHGTKSYKGEVITKQEADKRFEQYLNPLYELVNRSCYTDYQKIAMTSYMYNVGRYAMHIDKYIDRCSHKDIRYIMGVYGYTINGKRSSGLKKRRIEELYLFNS